MNSYQLPIVCYIVVVVAVVDNDDYDEDDKKLFISILNPLNPIQKIGAFKRMIET